MKDGFQETPHTPQIGTHTKSTRQEGLIHRELSEKILGAAMNVLNELKPGLDEKIYENALVIELHEQGLHVQQQKHFAVSYKGRLVGTLVPDLIVVDQVIVDPKVASAFTQDHLAQMLGYLAITRLELALLINFKYARLQWKRVVRSSQCQC